MANVWEIPLPGYSIEIIHKVNLWLPNSAMAVVNFTEMVLDRIESIGITKLWALKNLDAKRVCSNCWS